jgi:Lon protease-like protein
MTRQLPARPHLDHLKAQAKDLLDAHRRGEAEALQRIRASVPAFAGMSDEALARAAFALHDAQSAIAREYGFVSWAELRDKVAALTAAPATPPVDTPAPLEAAALDQLAQLAAGLGLTPEAAKALREAIAQRRALADAPTPATVPVLPLRNAVAFPGAVLPIEVSRATTVHAIEAAEATESRFVAIFAQRASGTEQPTQDELHTSGCLCLVLYVHGIAAGKSLVVIQGVRWITLEALVQTEPYYAARVSDAGLDRGDDQEIAALDRRLRDAARRFAETRPELRDRANAFLEQTKDIGQIADVAMAALQVPVDESAAYARETQLVRRLERAIAALEAALANPSAALPPA